MINSEDVKNAVVNQLLKTFPQINVYKEAKTTPVYPHFFVYQINFLDEEERKNYHILDYSINVRYRNSSDPSTNLKLEQNLDDVALKLSENFNIIAFDEGLIKCIEKSFEKVDGVLHFNFHIKLMAKVVSGEETIKQNKLSLEVKEKW